MEDLEVTMTDVARAAGVSIATVSRVLNDAPGVGAATRERVRREAERLSYVISPEASGLSRGSTGRVAVVVPGLTTWFYATMLAAIEQTLRAAALDVLIYQVDGPDQRAHFFAELPARRKVDAVVLIALPLTTEEAERLRDLRIDVVVAGGQVLDYPCVRIDDHAAARTAVTHLIDLGHERIAMVTAGLHPELYWSPPLERTRGYTEALTEAGLSGRPEHLVQLPYGPEAGLEGTRRLLELDERPTAIVTYSDEMALGALRALHQHGVAVPADTALISFDGHPNAALFGISTIDQQVAEQGRLAGQMALDLMAGNLTDHEILVDTHLVVRDSTAAPEHSRAG